MTVFNADTVKVVTLYRQACNTFLEQIDNTVKLFNDLDGNFKFGEERTKVMQTTCEKLLEEKTLNTTTETALFYINLAPKLIGLMREIEKRCPLCPEYVLDNWLPSSPSSSMILEVYQDNDDVESEISNSPTLLTNVKEIDENNSVNKEFKRIYEDFIFDSSKAAIKPVSAFRLRNNLKAIHNQNLLKNQKFA
ncbi:820_t:CDS:2 [Diversispora eburnea]|uniref:820_t:CDS:1 n=1 Tax=Diversispora eburnea TaxID=1213867 RepID=A0A9N9F052_9GLOM|nr:820_t:CDS:2 [Diversispora eburnea]